jgi:hypothetical protein
MILQKSPNKSINQSIKQTILYFRNDSIGRILFKLKIRKHTLTASLSLLVLGVWVPEFQWNRNKTNRNLCEINKRNVKQIGKENHFQWVSGKQKNKTERQKYKVINRKKTKQIENRNKKKQVSHALIFMDNFTELQYIFLYIQLKNYRCMGNLCL